MNQVQPSKHIGFLADEALMYLIQQTTKLPTEEILGFFYDFGMRVAEIGIDNMEGKSIRKDIRDVFPGSCIPFKLLVKGRKQRQWTPTGYSNNDQFSGSIEVTFPDLSRYVDHHALMEKIIERTLLDGESLPNFPQPKSKTPKMYKDLIQETIRTRHEQTLLDRGHTRADGPLEETLGRPHVKPQP